MGNLGLNIFNTGTKFIEAKELIKEVYLMDERPWVVGFSGGKDSTAVVQLVFQALQELNPSELHKKVYVISSDTQVETPLIIDKITRTLGRIQEKALNLGLPIETQKVRPKVEQTFGLPLSVKVTQHLVKNSDGVQTV